MIRYVKTNVCTQHCTVVIQKATYFSCTRQPLAGFMFQKCTKEIHVAVAIQNKVLCIDGASYCYVLYFCSLHFGHPYQYVICVTYLE